MLHSQASDAHLNPTTTSQASPSHVLSTEGRWKQAWVGRNGNLVTTADRLVQNTYLQHHTGTCKAAIITHPSFPPLATDPRSIANFCFRKIEMLTSESSVQIPSIVFSSEKRELLTLRLIDLPRVACWSPASKSYRKCYMGFRALRCT